MLASMTGSSLAARLMARPALRVELYMQIVFAVSSLSLLVPLFTFVSAPLRPTCFPRISLSCTRSALALCDTLHSLCALSPKVPYSSPRCTTTHPQPLLSAASPLPAPFQPSDCCVSYLICLTARPSAHPSAHRGYAMRSQFIPEEARATIMNFFRIPLNCFVCIVLYNVCECIPHHSHVGMCSIFLAMAAVLQRRLFAISSPSKPGTPACHCESWDHALLIAFLL
ncbi:unnamed protein product [Closterium sp. NIES-65]|nr:unnamed protein product [Closterium sp. NIES-65]